MAASSWAQSLAVTVSLVNSAKIGSIVKTVELMLITSIYIGRRRHIPTATATAEYR
jgi:hypothetical protein